MFTPTFAPEIANALADRLSSIRLQSPSSEKASLSAFVNDAFADYIDSEIERGLEAP